MEAKRKQNYFVIFQKNIGYCGILLCLACSTLCVNMLQADGFCKRFENGEIKCEKDIEKVTLVRHDAIKKGHIEQMDGIVPHKILQMKTVSVHPPVFEINNFLSDAECEHFINAAKRKGLVKSETFRLKEESGIQILDVNHDGKLSVSEMILTIEDAFDIYLREEDVLKMYEDMNSMDLDNDTFITPEELQKINLADLNQYINNIRNKNPERRSRMSEQVWLDPANTKDKVFISIQDRVHKLTKLPKVLIKNSDFQIVKYGMGGHYNAHSDSSSLNTLAPCCTKYVRSKCRSCRFMTILLYLNDVEEGGETAFPVADNKTYSSNVLRQSHHINLQQYCQSANLVLKPEKGKAVMWYSHFVDKKNGWMGEEDELTWHGGCPVLKGEKWISNFWIKTTQNKHSDLAGYL